MSSNVLWPVALRLQAEFYANEVMSHPFTFKLGGGKAARIGVVDLTSTKEAVDDRAAMTPTPVQDVKVSFYGTHLCLPPSPFSTCFFHLESFTAHH
eukprot:SAG31_NODE_26226_length_446_cov_0.720461_1_plen_95_part_01